VIAVASLPIVLGLSTTLIATPLASNGIEWHRSVTRAAARSIKPWLVAPWLFRTHLFVQDATVLSAVFAAFAIHACACHATR
jgi:hypothetical protein